MERRISKSFSLKIQLKNIFPIILVFLLSCSSKNSNQEIQSKNSTDSLSSKINSPELKASSAEILAHPDDASLYYNRSKIYFSLNEFNAAVNDAKRSIKLDSTNAKFYLNLVDIYFAQNQTRQVKDLLLIIERKFPENTEGLLKSAELFFLVKQYQKAIDFVNKALKIDDGLAKAYFIKGSVYRESGDTAKAISSLETAIEQDNKMEDAFYDLGVIYAVRKNKLALDYYDNVLKVNPNNIMARYARAKFLQDIGKNDEAIFEYEALIKQKKDCSECFYNLGVIFLNEKKNLNTAIEKFTKAIEVKPDYIEAYFARGYTYSLLKQNASAKADYEMCLKLVPDYELAAQALNKLK